MQCDVDRGTWLQTAIHDQVTHPVFDIVLYGTFQRTGTKLHVIALGCHKLLGIIAQLNGKADVADALEKSLQLNVEDALDGF